MKLIKKNYKIVSFCLIISTIVLLFTSCNSPLYPYNFANDTNAYFTIGRGWLEGLIPYKDLFDQKGPIVYFIFMIAALISKTSYIGIYILEVISMTIFLFYAHKTITLFIDKRNSLFILPTITVLICTTVAFTSGATAEEFTLPFFMFSLYYLINYFKGEQLTYKQYFINGLIAGIIFLIKFNLIFFWFGFMACIFIDLILQRKIKQAFKSGLIFVAGMLIPFIIFNIYFLLVGAIKDFYHAYFYFNIFTYGNTVSLLNKFQTGFNNFIYRCIENGFIILPLFICFLCFIQNIKIKTKYKTMFYIIFILTIFGIFFGSNYHYYILPSFVFLTISLIAICFSLQKVINKIFNNKIFLTLSLIILYTGLIFFSYKGANYKEMLNTNIKDYEIYKIVEEINKAEDKSMLNYQTLDNGIYNLTNTIPNVKYFFRLNVTEERYPKLMNSQRNYVKNKKTNFVLLTNAGADDTIYDILEGKYKLVKKATNIHQNPNNTQDIREFELYKKI